MNSDIVGSPIYNLSPYEDSPSLGDVRDAIQGLMAELPASVAIAFMVRVCNLIDYSEEVGANGVLLAGTTSLGKVSFFISEEDKDSILEYDIPEGLNDIECQKWLINKISLVSQERKLVVDAALCQCLCGYAGSPESWLPLLTR